MRVTYKRDDARRRVEIVAQGSFDATPLVAVSNRQREEGTWSYAVLCNGRHVIGSPTFDDLVLPRTETTVPGRHGERPGPLAIVVADAVLFRKASAYTVMVWTDRPVNVFQEINEAERWLLAQDYWDVSRR